MIDYGVSSLYAGTTKAINVPDTERLCQSEFAPFEDVTGKARHYFDKRQWNIDASILSSPKKTASGRPIPPKPVCFRKDALSCDGFLYESLPAFFTGPCCSPRRRTPQAQHRLSRSAPPSRYRPSYQFQWLWHRFCFKFDCQRKGKEHKGRKEPSGVVLSACMIVKNEEANAWTGVACTWLWNFTKIIGSQTPE